MDRDRIESNRLKSLLKILLFMCKNHTTVPTFLFGIGYDMGKIPDSFGYFKMRKKYGLNS